MKVEPLYTVEYAYANSTCWHHLSNHETAKLASLASSRFMIAERQLKTGCRARVVEWKGKVIELTIP